MRELGIKGLPTRRLPKGARVARVTSLDLVGRVFARDRPNELWMTDITEHPTREGKVFCAIVLDAFSRMVVGWAIDSTQTTKLVLNALGMATQRREHRDGLVIHSDRACNSPPGRLARTSVTPAWHHRWERSARPMTMPSWRASGAGCRSSCSTDAGGRPGSSLPQRSTITSSCFTTPAGGTPRSGRNPRSKPKPGSWSVRDERCPAKTAPDHSVDQRSGAGLSDLRVEINRRHREGHHQHQQHRPTPATRLHRNRGRSQSPSNPVRLSVPRVDHMAHARYESLASLARAGRMP
jgi:Integrase core domain